MIENMLDLAGADLARRQPGGGALKGGGGLWMGVGGLGGRLSWSWIGKKEKYGFQPGGGTP